MRVCVQHVAPSCLYCGDKVMEAASSSSGGGGSGGSGSHHESARALREAIAAASGADASWCLERGELEALHARVQQARASSVARRCICPERPAVSGGEGGSGSCCLSSEVMCAMQP